MSKPCKGNPCYLTLMYNGKVEMAFYADPEHTAPYIFRCDHEAGAAALQLLEISREAWLAGQASDMLKPWDLKIVYTADTEYKEPSEGELDNLAPALDILSRFMKG